MSTILAAAPVRPLPATAWCQSRMASLLLGRIAAEGPSIWAHSGGTARAAVALIEGIEAALARGLPGVDLVRTAAGLHDIGKSLIPA